MWTLLSRKILVLVVLFFSFLAGYCGGGSNKKSHEINVYCNQNNDLYQLLVSNGLQCRQFSEVATAISETNKNGILLILAKDYPSGKTVLPKDFYKTVKEKKLKVYLEFPDQLEADATGEIKPTEKERLVTTSDFFGNDLALMTIMDAGLFSYVDVPERTSHIRGASVAGFDKAVYGLDNTPNFPILFNEGQVLVSTTKLSDFNKSRYSPLSAWQKTIGSILSFISVEVEVEKMKWEPIVKPTYEASASLPENAYRLAVEKGAEWYIKSRFLIHPEWKDHWKAIDTLKLPVGPPMDLSLPSGDGSLGVLEGHYSYINPDGSQPYRYWLRADCVAETAMTFAMADNIKGNAQSRKITRNLMDFLFNTDVFKTPDSKNPKMSSYGLIGWAGTHPYRYYGDDNARVLLGSVLAAQYSGNGKWDKQILELILANFRTSGETGFRSNALNGWDIDEKTWQTLMKGQLVNPAPHFESWLWATYIWLYDKTGYKPLLEKAKRGIRITMDNYPDNWIWTNGIQQERARMILPLAWLVRAEDTAEHRKWLSTICDALLKNQVESGALREELGGE
ncbi:hypothetical protein [Reichenbachiella sp. MALMAid0571]|uniref:hypothetical protein n=1 Tax=Reichenbachiella sp. MALMAid0571 TaxID=3143939 RepID=UPI0032E00C70